MKSVIITGEGSYIGTMLCKHLLAQNGMYAVQIVSTVEASPESFDFCGADAVINVAAIVHRKDTPGMQSLYDSVNRDLAVIIAEKAKSDGVPLLIQFSTMSVYGMQTGVITKSTPPHPVTAYAKSKLEAERRIAPLADESFAVAILRPPMVYGPGAKGNYRTLEKLTRYLFFCPTVQNKRSLISIDRLCEYVRKRIDEARSGIFFPQDPSPVSTVALIEQIASDAGRKLWKTSLFNPMIQLLVKETSVGKKAFGDLLYDDLSELPLSAAFFGGSI